jgi:hypothetical protein
MGLGKTILFGRGGTHVKLKLVENRFDEFKRDAHIALKQTLEDAADEIVADARKAAPVSTGRLRDSIKAKGK